LLAKPLRKNLGAPVFGGVAHFFTTEIMEPTEKNLLTHLTQFSLQIVTLSGAKGLWDSRRTALLRSKETRGFQTHLPQISQIDADFKKIRVIRG
jgi:hypothetical protein